MGKTTVISFVTLDGVIPAPARPDEDIRGGITRGDRGLLTDTNIQTRAKTLSEIIEHLSLHREAGHNIPDDTVDDFTGEAGVGRETSR